jgi:hypothetical protein
VVKTSGLGTITWCRHHMYWTYGTQILSQQVPLSVSLLGLIGYDEDSRQSGPIDSSLVSVESAIGTKVQREKLGKLAL